MNAETLIKKKLLNNLGINDVEVINNSHLHQNHQQSPNNGISHFKLITCEPEELAIPNKTRPLKIDTPRNDRPVANLWAFLG